MGIEKIYRDSKLFSLMPVLCYGYTWSCRWIEFGWGCWIYSVKWTRKFPDYEEDLEDYC